MKLVTKCLVKYCLAIGIFGGWVSTIEIAQSAANLQGEIGSQESPAEEAIRPQSHGSSEVESEGDVFSVMKDQRLLPPKDLNGYFPFVVPEGLAEWQKQKLAWQSRLNFVLGLEPPPVRSALNPVIGQPEVFEGYSISKVYFESMPGFYVTGSLYRPVDGIQDSATPRLRPAVLCPHGHWANGRFMYASDTEVADALRSGAEAIECAARSPLQARCVHLARMGCIVFHYDMLGNADSVQLSQDVVHRFSQQRLKLSSPERWGLYSPKAETNAQSIMGLQTWNSIRSLDFLETLPDVDTGRIAVTGASGGGTQTFILCAIDARPAVAFPAVMVCTAMQGGCTCENCSLLRIRGGNVEIAALFAPKPLGMTAADDWTVEMETKGFPQLKTLYQKLGASDDVSLTSRTEFGHNYNQVGRKAMYQWVAKYFGLSVFPESEFKLQNAEKLTVWKKDDAGRVILEGAGRKLLTGDELEASLMRQWKSQKDEALRKRLFPDVDGDGDGDGLAGLERHRQVLSDVYLGDKLAVYQSSDWQLIDRVEVEGVQRQRWRLWNDALQQLVPVTVYRRINPSPVSKPDNANAVGQIGKQDRPDFQGGLLLCLGNGASDVLDPNDLQHQALAVDDAGKQAVAAGEKVETQDFAWKLNGWAESALLGDVSLVCLDLFGQGEFQRIGDFSQMDLWAKTDREFSGYVYGYNDPLLSHQARDILHFFTAVSQMATRKTDAVSEKVSIPIDLLASGEGAIALTVAAVALQDLYAADGGFADLQFDSVSVLIDGFRFQTVTSLLDRRFLPGGAVYGDVPGWWMLNQIPNVKLIDTHEVNGAASGFTWQEVNQIRKNLGSPQLKVLSANEMLSEVRSK